MKRKLSVVLGISGGILFGIIGLCFGLVSFLHSPEGSRFILQKLQTSLQQRAHINLVFKNAIFDPFSRILLEGVQLSYPSPSERVELTAKSIEIRYPLSLSSLLFQKVLKIEELSIDVQADQIELIRTYHDQMIQIRLTNLDWKSKTKLLAESQSLFPLSLDSLKNSLKDLDTEGTLTSGPVDYTFSQGRKIQTLHLDSQKALLKGSLSAGEIRVKYSSTSLGHFDLNAQFGRFPKTLRLSSQVGFELTPGLAQLIEPFAPILSTFREKGWLHPPWEVTLDSEAEWEPRTEQLDFQGTLRLKNPFGKWITKADFRSEFQSARSSLQMKGSASIEEDGPSSFKELRFLLPLKAEFNASKEGNHRFTLKELRANLNQSFAKLAAEATGDSKAGNFQTQGTLTLDLPHPTEVFPLQKVDGHIEVPWTLALYRGRDIHFEGLMNILNLNWTRSSTKEPPSKGRVVSLSGKIPISEHLIWDQQTLKYSELIQQNPFERVDFDRLQPMISDSAQIFIQKIGLEEKTYGPLQGFVSMRQNRVFVHRFDLKMGNGKANGEMFVDIYPINPQLGILARMTDLKLPELLPKKYWVKAPSGDPRDQRISGRSGIVLSLNSGTINGRVDITEIGKNQLITLINILDPHYENQQMNRARFALAIASPSWIQMSFQQGFLDLGFKLESPIRQEFALRGIPISSWVSRAKTEFMKKPQEGAFHE